LTAGKTESQVRGTRPQVNMNSRLPRDKPPNPSPKEARAERLAEVLRANLKRRKNASRGQMGGKGNTNDEQSSGKS
jgi:hypothetical protein